jgi:hypothetical protein
MKKIIFLLLAVTLLAGSAYAWQGHGSSGNPLIDGYFTTLYGQTILPISSNSGSVGAVGNAFNFGNFDSLRLADSLFAWKTAGGKRNIKVDTVGAGSGRRFMLGNGSDTIAIGFATYYMHAPSNAILNIVGGTDRQINMSSSGTAGGIRIYNAYGDFSTGNQTIGGYLSFLSPGSRVIADTLSGYNGNRLVIPSFGITITGVDTLFKLAGSLGDSFKVVSVSGKASSVSSGGDPDTIIFKAAGDSLKVPWVVGAKWLGTTAVNKKWARADTCFIIFRKGATTAAANFFLSVQYGESKGRVF